MYTVCCAYRGKRHYGLNIRGVGGILLIENRGTAACCAPDLDHGQRRGEKMVFICDHCHFEMECGAKPGQCPDCGKVGHIRTATAEESQAFQARKLEDVWHDAASAMAG